MSDPIYPSHASDGTPLPTGEMLDRICSREGRIADIWREHRDVCRRRAQLISEATSRFGPPPPDVLLILDEIESLWQLKCMNNIVMPDARSWHQMIAGVINRSRYRVPDLLKFDRPGQAAEDEPDETTRR